MLKKKYHSVLAMTAIAICAASLARVSLSLADDPATKPSSIVSVSDQAALDASMGQDVTLEGRCTEAAWSASGKVMNVRFEATEQTHASAVVFLKDRETIDAAFNGDAAKAWTGAKLRIRGKLREYGGKAGGRKGAPEITINDVSQVTVVELPATAPTTHSTTQPTTRATH